MTTPRGKEKARRAAIYARVSKLEMTNEEFDSTDGQAARCRDLARAHGMRVEATYTDASTGSNTDRPELQALLADAAAGRFDVVLCFKLDRISRSCSDFWRIVETLQGQGVGLVSVCESFDSSTPTGRLMMGIISNFAQYELETIKLRTKQGLSSRAEAGYWPARHTPFGYRRECNGDGAPTTLAPDENARLVREAFKRYVDGDGPGLLAKWLNEESALPHDGKPWSGRRVRTMLAQPAYVGLVKWNGEVSDGNHPCIVSPDLWREVQRRLATGQRGKCKKPRDMAVDGHRPALLGLLRDPEGVAFSRYWVANGEGRKYVYYVDPSSGHRLNAGALDDEIARVIREVVASPDMFAGTLDAARRTHEKKAAAVERRAERLGRDVASLDKKRDRLIDAVADGLPADAANAKLGELAQHRTELQGRLSACEAERTALEKQRQSVDTFARMRRFFEAIGDGDEFIDTASILRAVVHHVTLDVTRERAVVALNLPASAGFSNSRDAEIGQLSQLPDSSGSISSDVPTGAEEAVSLSSVGEGETVGSLSVSYGISEKRGAARIYAA